MILVKTGVIFKRLKPEIYGVLDLVDEIFTINGAYVVITSANDGKHMAGSRHYTDDALDLRSKHVQKPIKSKVLTELRLNLGDDYDVLLENVGKPNEHYHLEFDKK